ncbi:MAG: hypothetical protein RRY29_09640 [Desulfovibrionaceae bacterium]
MLNTLFIAYATNRDISKDSLARRVTVIRNFWNLDDPEKYVTHHLHDAHAGLVYILPKKMSIDIPVLYCSPQRMTLTAYFPFGVTPYVSSHALHSGEYLPSTVERLCKNPRAIRELAPPQVWCDMNAATHTMNIFNDFRGFGRIYEHQSDFGTIWTNKTAAAPLFSATQTAVNPVAWAQMATLGMFSANYIGHANMRLLPPETHICVVTDTGITTTQSQSAGLFSPFSQLPAHAVEETSHAMYQWHKELEIFSSLPKVLSLSGGRDSRVLAAFSIATRMNNLSFMTSYPPQKDYDIAKQLVASAPIQIEHVGQNRRGEIQKTFDSNISLLDYSSTVLHTANEDISVASALSCGIVKQSDSPSTIDLGGFQGEVAHACYYTQTMYDQEKKWKDECKGNKSPSEKRITTFFEQLSTKQVGVSSFAANIMHQCLQAIRTEADLLDINGFYFLDYLYLVFWLNRQWAGAESINSSKTPLTLYPYVHYGLRQPIESKLHSQFIRDVIQTAMPQWKNIPFFHELPAEETNDFSSSYPTYWDAGRGDEVASMVLGNTYLWEYFDKASVLEAFLQFRDPALWPDTPKKVEWNRAAQKILWTIAFYNQVETLNTLVKELSE